MPDFTNLYAPDTAFEDFLEQVRAALGARLKRIVLFGSRARGDSTPESDYDCLIVVDEPTSAIRNKLYDIAGEVLVEHSIVVFAYPISEARFDDWQHDPLLMNVQREGVALHESKPTE